MPVASLVATFSVVAAMAGQRSPSTTDTSSSVTSMLSRRRDQLLAASAGAAGVGLGYLTTPKLTPPKEGVVRTAEAWRRRVQGRSRISLAERSPRILCLGAACFTLAEYKLAFDACGSHKSSMARTSVGCAVISARRASLKAAASLRKWPLVARTEERWRLFRAGPGGAKQLSR